MIRNKLNTENQYIINAYINGQLKYSNLVVGINYKEAQQKTEELFNSPEYKKAYDYENMNVILSAPCRELTIFDLIFKRNKVKNRRVQNNEFGDISSITISTKHEGTREWEYNEGSSELAKKEFAYFEKASRKEKLLSFSFWFWVYVIALVTVHMVITAALQNTLIADYLRTILYWFIMGFVALFPVIKYVDTLINDRKERNKENEK